MQSITRIYTATPHLEPKHLQLVMDVEHCHYFWMLPTVGAHPLTNNDLQFLAEPLHDYFDKASRLQDYADNNLVLSGTPEPP